MERRHQWNVYRLPCTLPPHQTALGSSRSPQTALGYLQREPVRRLHPLHIRQVPVYQFSGLFQTFFRSIRGLVTSIAEKMAAVSSYCSFREKCISYERNCRPKLSPMYFDIAMAKSPTSYLPSQTEARTSRHLARMASATQTNMDEFVISVLRE